LILHGGRASLLKELRAKTGRHVQLIQEQIWNSIADEPGEVTFSAYIVPGINQDCTSIKANSPEELLAKTKKLFTKPHDRHPTDNPL
jgi:hypothetical protein